MTASLARKVMRAWKAWLLHRRVRKVDAQITSTRRRHGRVRPLEKQKQDLVHEQLRKELGIKS
jgi:hypothetical protein